MMTTGAGDDHALLCAWTELARRACSVHAAYTGGAAAVAHHRRAVAGFLCRARLEGAIHTRWRGDRLGAVVTTHPDPESWYGVRQQPIVVNRDPDDAAAIQWIVDRVVEIGVGPETDMFVFAADRIVIDRLLTACPALGVDAVILLGEPRSALAALVEQRDPPSLIDLGFDLGPVADTAEVDRLVDMTRDTFTAHPEWCWFGTTGRQLARERAGLLLGVGGGDPDDLTEVIRCDGQVVGMMQMHLADNPLWGRTAGVGLLLDRSLWGRGLLKPMYRRMLERLVAANVDTFKGGTSQGPVMHLGRLMGRPLHAAVLRTDTHYPRRHFDRYLGPSAGSPEPAR